MKRIQKAAGSSLPKEMTGEIRFCQQIWQKYAKFLREVEKEETSRAM